MFLSMDALCAVCLRSPRGSIRPTPINSPSDSAVVFRAMRGRRGWLQVMRGDLVANGEPLSAGDGLALQQAEVLQLEAASSAELLLFDMA